MGDRKEVYRGVTQAELDRGFIKVGLPVGDIGQQDPTIEWCWATKLSETYAKLDNTVVFTDVAGFGDVIQFCELSASDGGPHEFFKGFVRRISVGSTQLMIRYASKRELRKPSPAREKKLVARLKNVRDYCDQLPEDARPMYVEGWCLGFAVVAFPAHVDSWHGEKLLEGCPCVQVD